MSFLFLTGCLANFLFFVFVYFLVHRCGYSLLRAIRLVGPSTNWSSVIRQHILRFVLLLQLAGVVYTFLNADFRSNVAIVDVVGDVLFGNWLVLQILLNAS